jgi:thioredoxin 1
MKKKIILAVLTLLLVGCGEAKVESKTPIASPLKKTQEASAMLEATPYAQIASQIGKTPMLVEFGSTSCASCVEMEKLLYRAKQEYPQSAIYFVEVYNDQPATRDYRIQMIPTQIYLDAKGAESDRHIGAVTYEQLIAKLKAQNVIF